MERWQNGTTQRRWTVQRSGRPRSSGLWPVACRPLVADGGEPAAEPDTGAAA